MKQKEEQESKTQAEQGFSVIPKGELPCVWMLAGVLSYKLCDRNYQCETCPLDMEIGHLYRTDVEPASSKYPFELENFHHYPSHVWVKPVTSERALIGIDQFIAALSSEIDGVLLPKIGQKISHSSWLVKFIVDDEVINIGAPVAGVVLSANISIIKSPEILIASPYEKGWLLETEIPNLKAELEFSIPHEQVSAWLSEQIHKLNRKIGLEIGAEKNPGILAQDGLMRSDLLKKSLGAKGYAKLIRSFVE